MTGYPANSNYEQQGGKIWVVDGEIQLNGIIKVGVTSVDSSLTLTKYHSGNVVISSASTTTLILPDAEDGLIFSFTNIGVGDVVLVGTIHGDSSFTLFTDENISLSASNSSWYLF